MELPHGVGFFFVGKVVIGAVDRVPVGVLPDRFAYVFPVAFVAFVYVFPVPIVFVRVFAVVVVFFGYVFPVPVVVIDFVVIVVIVGVVIVFVGVVIVTAHRVFGITRGVVSFAVCVFCAIASVGRFGRGRLVFVFIVSLVIVIVFFAVAGQRVCQLCIVRGYIRAVIYVGVQLCHVRHGGLSGGLKPVQLQASGFGLRANLLYGGGHFGCRGCLFVGFVDTGVVVFVGLAYDADARIPVVIPPAALQLAVTALLAGWNGGEPVGGFCQGSVAALSDSHIRFQFLGAAQDFGGLILVQSQIQQFLSDAKHGPGVRYNPADRLACGGALGD